MWVSRLTMLVAAQLLLAASHDVRGETPLPPVVQEDVLACTRGDAALSLLEAVKSKDRRLVENQLAGDSCSRFSSMEYAPIKYFYRDDGEYNILYVRAFHLIDMYVVTRGQ